MVCYLLLGPAELRRMCLSFWLYEVCPESELQCVYYSLGHVFFGAVMYALISLICVASFFFSLQRLTVRMFGTALPLPTVR